MPGDITLVFGPPGTGKTTWLQRNAAEMAKVDPDAREDMIAVSFSNAAAQVLRSRMGLDQERAGTLHSLGRQYLQGAPIIDAPPRGNDTSGSDLVKAWNDDYPQWKVNFGWSGPDPLDQLHTPGVIVYEGSAGNRLHAAMNLFRQCLYPVEEWPGRAAKYDYLTQAEIREFSTEWERFKHRHACIDFTDMIERPYREGAAIPFGASVVYTDEAQDNTPLIMARVMQLAELMDDYGSLFVALDDDQTIYSHLGCNPRPLLALEDVNRVHLEQSYRLPQAIHHYSQAWIKRLHYREDKPFLPSPESVGLVETRELSISRKERAHVEGLVEAVRGELAEGRSVMLLAATNLFAGQLVATLREGGIPFHNPNRPTNGQWNPLGASAGGLKGPSAAILAWAKILDGKMWTPRDVGRIAAFIKTAGYIRNAAKLQRDLEAMDHEELDDDIDEWFIEEYFTSPGAFAELASGDARVLRGLLPTVSGSLKGAYNLEIWERFGPKGLSQKPQVTVGTIHSVKGDEADTVFLFPDISKSTYESLRDPAGHDHAVRVMYVAMTRARQRLYICKGQSGNAIIRLPKSG